MKRLILLALASAIAIPAQSITQGDRNRALSELHATRKAFLDSVQNLTDAQWRFKPARDRWSIAEVAEHITLGQRVQEYLIEAWDSSAWKPIAKGTTIGHKKLDRFPDVTARKVRLTIRKALACPTIRAFGLYQAPK